MEQEWWTSLLRRMSIDSDGSINAADSNADIRPSKNILGKSGKLTNAELQDFFLFEFYEQYFCSNKHPIAPFYELCSRLVFVLLFKSSVLGATRTTLLNT